MNVYLLGTLVLLSLHQAAAKGRCGASAAGGCEPAEGLRQQAAAGVEGGSGARSGLLALMGGAGGGGGKEAAEGGAPRNLINNLQQQPQTQGMMALGRGSRDMQHDEFSWSGALMRSYLLHRVIELIEMFS